MYASFEGDGVKASHEVREGNNSKSTTVTVIKGENGYVTTIEICDRKERKEPPKEGCCDNMDVKNTNKLYISKNNPMTAEGDDEKVINQVIKNVDSGFLMV